MARKEQTARSTATKRKESPAKEVEETTTKRAKTETVDLEGKNVGNVVGGYKATLHNANASEEAKEHAEKMIEELEPMAIDQREAQEGVEGKNIGNVVGGYKATLKNANASEEAKEHAEMMIEKLEPQAEENRKAHSSESIEGKNVGNVIGGYKATLSNANASEEAKEHAEKMIEKLGGDVEERKTGHELSDGNTEGKNIGNVIGGFKAALHNPNVSEEAKEHAREMIEKLGGDVNENRSIVEKKYQQRATSDTDLHGKDLSHVVAGYKGTLSNPNTSREAKEHAIKMLDQLHPHHSEGRDMSHVVAGYKATLSNPKTSDEARRHAELMLEELSKYGKQGKNLEHFVSEYKEKSTRSDLSTKEKEHYSRAHSHLESHHREGKHLGNVIGGYKATLSNAKTSEEAKEHARRMLEELGADYETDNSEKPIDSDGKNINNVLGGYKAALHNPNVSDEAKEHAREVLEENGASEKSTTGRSSTTKSDHEKNPNNVIGGLKGALKNPNNSEEAKDEVRAKLDQIKTA